MALSPDQPSEAVQDSAEVEDQDKSSVLFSSIELAPDIETLGADIETLGADDPPPPQALSSTNVQKKGKNLE